VVEKLRNVLWIGGVAGAGKTTVARRLARRYGLRRYNPDTQTWNHLGRELAKGNPAAQRFSRMTPAERAVATPEEIDYDRGPMIVEDLRSLSAAPLVLAELAPPYPVIASMGQAVLLMPSQDVQRVRLERRHPQGVPLRYLRSWQTMTEKLEEAGTHVIVVDDLTIDDTTAEVERFFAHRIAEGPKAETIEQRRDLLRYANQAVVAQYLGWSHYTPAGDVRKAVLEFDCECAEPTCTALVRLPFGDASTAVTSAPPSILATGHSA
jgi:adenylate kinase family enzyme